MDHNWGPYIPVDDGIFYEKEVIPYVQTCLNCGLEKDMFLKTA